MGKILAGILLLSGSLPAAVDVRVYVSDEYSGKLILNCSVKATLKNLKGEVEYLHLKINP